jgi:hypothetical protein
VQLILTLPEVASTNPLLNMNSYKKMERNTSKAVWNYPWLWEQREELSPEIHSIKQLSIF